MDVSFLKNSTNVDDTLYVISFPFIYLFSLLTALISFCLFFYSAFVKDSLGNHFKQSVAIFFILFSFYLSSFYQCVVYSTYNYYDPSHIGPSGPRDEISENIVWGVVEPFSKMTNVAYLSPCVAYTTALFRQNDKFSVFVPSICVLAAIMGGGSYIHHYQQSISAMWGAIVDKLAMLIYSGFMTAFAASGFAKSVCRKLAMGGEGAIRKCESVFWMASSLIVFAFIVNRNSLPTDETLFACGCVYYSLTLFSLFMKKVTFSNWKRGKKTTVLKELLFCVLKLADSLLSFLIAIFYQRKAQDILDVCWTCGEPMMVYEAYHGIWHLLSSYSIVTIILLTEDANSERDDCLMKDEEDDLSAPHASAHYQNRKWHHCFTSDTTAFGISVWKVCNAIFFTGTYFSKHDGEQWISFLAAISPIQMIIFSILCLALSLCGSTESVSVPSRPSRPSRPGRL